MKKKKDIFTFDIGYLAGIVRNIQVDTGQLHEIGMALKRLGNSKLGEELICRAISIKANALVLYDDCALHHGGK